MDNAEVQQRAEQIYIESEIDVESSPENLDIIKIDGRWAQVATPIRNKKVPLKYLDDNSSQVVDLSGHELVKQYSGAVVKNLIDFGFGEFSEQEIDNIHWGSDQKDNVELKKGVTVFGEYEKME